ncbi:bifunctional tetrahydrofolate synthase/dihydrofolate synthase [Thiolapillus sp.]
MRFNKLEDWLSWQESLNPKSIDLGLERVQQVWRQLVPPDLAATTVISIAGTNGKGSSVALFESTLQAAGYTTGSYTSPHLLRYNERIRCNGQPLPDEQIMAAFDTIDKARGATLLTYFEFGTLAALYHFAHQKPDVVLLEVGLGGRLDAVNIIDADLALVTSIALDHQQWLGDDLESIGREKAGIFRPGRPAVFSALQMPDSVEAVAAEVKTPLYRNGRDFHGERNQTGNGWNWQSRERGISNLPLPALPGPHQLDNAAGVIMALQLLAPSLPVSENAIRQGLVSVEIPGRQQLVERNAVQWLLDVAHNSHAVAQLARYLKEHPVSGQTRAVLGMLRDKDASQVATLMKNEVQAWHLAGIDAPRGMNAKELTRRIMTDGFRGQSHENLKNALQTVDALSRPGDRVVVFGSFYTVAEALDYLKYPAGVPVS